MPGGRPTLDGIAGSVDPGLRVHALCAPYRERCALYHGVDRACLFQQRQAAEEPQSLLLRHPGRVHLGMGLDMGDWQDKLAEQRSAMPVHYSGLRYIKSVRVKHLVWAYMGELRSYPFWGTPSRRRMSRSIRPWLIEVQL